MLCVILRNSVVQIKCLLMKPVDQDHVVCNLKKQCRPDQVSLMKPVDQDHVVCNLKKQCSPIK